MSSTVAQAPGLRVIRLIKAQRERVFAAWTKPDDIVKWFAPETCRALSAKMDLRVGGHYHLRVKGEEMGELDLRGVFREVRAPSKLVYTWNWKGNPQIEIGETLVTVDFVERNGFTEVQITHDGFPNEEHREDHKQGWNGCLDKLERLMAGSAEDQTPSSQPNTFCWNELLAADVKAAAKFYSQIFGWQTADFPGGMKYTLFKKDERQVGGLMQRPGPDCPPQWMAYVTVKNVDLTAKKVSDQGGKIMLPPTDIPTVGRIAVFQDPQGAALGIIQPAEK